MRTAIRFAKLRSGRWVFYSAHRHEVYERVSVPRKGKKPWVVITGAALWTRAGVTAYYVLDSIPAQVAGPT